jgi:hypothetical protein
MFFEGWVVQLASEPWAWEGHPMNPSNNVNGIDGDLNHDGRGTEIDTLEDYPTPGSIRPQGHRHGE